MKLFEYAVMFNYKDDEKPSELIVPVKTVMAETIQAATLLAARDIPEKYAKKLDQCEVAVRPF
jgi:hypothetical protein